MKKRLLCAVLAVGLVHAMGGEYEDRNLVKRNFAGEILNGVSFAGSDLSSSNFSKAHLSGADFTKAILLKTNFKPGLFGTTDLRGAFFNKAKIQANFDKALLQDSDFTDADIEPGTTFNKANLKDANFKRAHFHGSKKEVDKILEGALNVDPKNFPPGIIGEVIPPAPPVLPLKPSTPKQPNRSDSDIADVARHTIEGQPWTEKEKRELFKGGDFVNADFKGQPGRGSFAGVNFSDANLTGARFWKNTRIAQAKFDNAILDGTDFSSLKQDDLDRADFRNVSPAMLDKAKWPAQSELTTVLFKGGYKPNR